MALNILNTNENNSIPSDLINDPKFNIPFRLIIKNIPSNLSDQKIEEIFQNRFPNEINNETLIVKLDKNYAMKKRNKICFVTVNNLQARDKVYNFFSTFELIDPKGFKQKLSVNDCIQQGNLYTNNIPDPIENTIEEFEHFKKFKEFFDKEKLIDFKNDESKYCDKLFDGLDLPEVIPNNDQLRDKQLTNKKIITKRKNNNDNSNSNQCQNNIKNKKTYNNNNKAKYYNSNNSYNNGYYESNNHYYGSKRKGGDYYDDYNTKGGYDDGYDNCKNHYGKGGYKKGGYKGYK